MRRALPVLAVLLALGFLAPAAAAADLGSAAESPIIVCVTEPCGPQGPLEYLEYVIRVACGTPYFDCGI